MARACSLGVALVLFFLSVCVCHAELNLVFVTVDDLRTEHEIRTPHMDALADRGVNLLNAHANVALCGPSRASFLTGMFPRSLCYYHHKLSSDTATTTPDSAALDRAQCGTLPGYLRRNGYQVFGAGKVFHLSQHSVSIFGGSQYFMTTSSEACDRGRLFCQVEEKEAEDQVALRWGEQRMQAAIRDARPFAFFLGMRKPHMPFRVPAAAWEDVGGFKGNDYPEFLPALRNNVRPNPRALSNYFCSAMKKYPEVDAVGATTQLEAEPYPIELALAVRKGYFAAVKWADRVIGKLVSFLTVQGVLNNTVVVITSDNGMLLGEHGNWCKQSNYDIGTRVPWIVFDPLSAHLGRRQTDELVSLVDMYPTTIELLGLAPRSCLEGVSRAAVIRGAQGEPHNRSKFAFSLAARCVTYKSGKRRLRSCRSISALNHIGYSVRTKRWRYTEWRPVVGKDCKRVSDWDAPPLEAELYDHVDAFLYKPGRSENINLVGNEIYEGDAFLEEVTSVMKRALVYHYKDECDGQPDCGLSSLTIPVQTSDKLYLEAPTSSPETTAPSASPSVTPTALPSASPTNEPSSGPISPTGAPSITPNTREPTFVPSSIPTVRSNPLPVLTDNPTGFPLSTETGVPSKQPSPSPSAEKIVGVRPEQRGQAQEEVDIGFVSGVTVGSILLILVLGFLLTRGGKESPIQQWNPLDF